MSKCAICGKMMHQDFFVEKEVRGDLIKSCLFCHLNKNTLTIVDDNDNIIRKVTKEQCVSDYIRFLRKLSETPKIAKLLVKNNAGTGT